MSKIIIPQSNPNDEFVFITEWKFKNNDYIKKGDHILSIETSKVVEEIHAEVDGYLEQLFEINTKVKVGTEVATINPHKKDLRETNENKSGDKIFTKKAEILIKQHSININSIKELSNSSIIRESDILKHLANKKSESKNQKNQKKLDQLIILNKNNESYHAAIYLEDKGLIDLTLLGAKITNLKDYNFADCKCNFFKITIQKKDKAIKFFEEPNLLTEKIIKKEKSSRGWFKKVESADYILNFRNKRSKDSDDMNCIEWLVYGLELGGLKIPENILTASLLKKWARENLQEIQYNENLEYFQKHY